MINPEMTLALIKPDAVMKGVVGQIISTIEPYNLTIADVTVCLWDKRAAELFYLAHAERVFYPDLVRFMTSGPIWALTLVGPSAVRTWREMMGATDPRSADPESIRGRFGNKEGIIMQNAVHGSDSVASAKEEIALVSRSVYVSSFGLQAQRLCASLRSS